MLRSKAFAKKTKKGNVVRVISEHYLRDDIPCRSSLCSSCTANSDSDTLLDSDPRSTGRFAFAHYLIPDTNVLVNQIDLFEHRSMRNVIILQTVLDELRNLSGPKHARLREVIANSERRFVVFSNEHHRATFVDRLPEESANDRNDRAIRMAAQWYRDHLAAQTGAKVGAVLLTDDAGNRGKAEAMGLSVSTMRDYVAEMQDYPELSDMLAQVDARAESEALRQQDMAKYDEHLSKLQIQAGLKSGRYLQGKLNVSTHNYLEGSIVTTVNGVDRSVLILGRQNMSRAIMGDIVAVELLPESEWLSTPTEVLLDDGTGEEKQELEDASSKQAANGSAVKKSRSDDETTTVSAATAAASTAQPTARVVGLVRRNWRQYCGYIAQQSVRTSKGSEQSTSVLFCSMDRRIPRIRIRTRQAHSLVGQRILVAMDNWDRESRYPSGHFVRALGAAGDRATETEVLLMEHDVPHHPFGAHVLRDLPAEGEGWIVRDEHVKGRWDLRDLTVCSIDPPGCTDIDDALHARPLPNGNYSVGVHIADVTHFVRPHTAMDKEAANRCTTVYLVDRRIDMLPPLLGTNLCSLRSNVDRLAFSVIWEIEPATANIVKVEFNKSIIRSKASLTYDAAQKRIDDPSLTDELTENIRALNRIAKVLRAKRIANGALTLASPEVRFNLENDSQDPVDVELKELKETNALVEEFMLLANISVARRIFEQFPESAMLRRHPVPPSSNFDTFAAAVAKATNNQCILDVASSKTLSDSLDRAVKPEDPYFNKLVRILVTRCVLQAQYFCSGLVSREDFLHYGLAADIYTHFTSPIRRYADVVVHRLLAATITMEAKGSYDSVELGFAVSDIVDKVRMNEQCDMLNHRHRMAQQASRSSVELFTNLFFRGKTIEEEAYVTRVLKNGFSVLIPRYGVEGFVYGSPASSSSTSSKSNGDASNKTASAGSKRKSNAKNGGSTADDDNDDDETQVLQFNAEENALEYPQGGISLRMFDRVMVQITVDVNLRGGGEGGLHQKLAVSLIEPAIPGLSVAAQTPSAKAVVSGSDVVKGKSLDQADKAVVEQITRDLGVDVAH
ncbi:exosome complex exonuclease RRP44-like protein [Ramicandelaber brevisporus]|nr:exosome complex exonuclease RRP44-like protein [Ramicandelaber brevisporus]